MAHAVESMMYAGQIPWHRLGKKVHEGVTTSQAIKEAGLDWQVAMAPLYTGKEHGNQLTDHRAIIREKDKSILGVVGPNYTPLQNSEAFKFFDPFIENDQALLETAGSLRKGRDIWVLAKLNRDPIEIVKGDVVEKFLLLSNSHRGGVSVRVGFTPVRVVCANTLAMAIGNKNSTLMRVSHSSKVVTALDEVRSIMNMANAEFEATAEQYKLLAKRNISKSDLKKYVRVVFKTNDGTGRAKLREEKMMETIQRLFETGMGNDKKNVRGTYWALYNATTQYLTHEAGKDEDRRLYNLWFGRGFDANKQALDLAVKMAGAQ